MEPKSSHGAQTQELEVVKTNDADFRDDAGLDVYEENGVHHKVCCRSVTLSTYSRYTR